MSFKTRLLSGALGLIAAASTHAAVLADFNAGTLTLTAQNEAQIVVTCSAGNVAVNGNTSLTPASVACTAVTNLLVNGDDLGNTIDLGAITATDFTALSSSTLHGGDGNDTIIGSLRVDTITGGIGNDTVDANPGNDSIDLGAGDDTNTWNNGDNTDVVLGGDGNDRQIVNGAGAGDVFTVIPGVAPVAVRFDRTNLVPFGIDLTTVETLEMNSLGGDDSISAGTLTAGLIALELHGGDGNDTLVGSNGIDLITGGIGNDTVDANPGNDSIDLGTGDDTNTWNNGDNTDVVLGGDGNDRQIVNGAGAGDVFTVIPGVAPVAVRFDRTNLVPFGIDLTTVETLEMNSLGGDDSINAGTLTAGLIALELHGGDGNDTLVGSNGIDLITGGIGNDTVDANPGNDSIDLGTGDDTNTWNNGDNTDVVLGGDGNDRQIVNGAGAGDVFTVIPGVAPVAVRFDRTNLVPFGIDLTTVETLEMNSLGGDDSINAGTLTAGLIALELHGGDGNDTLVGSNGIDLITGGIGNDTVDANPGNDSIDLGTGDDTNTWNNGDNTDVVLGGDGNDRQIVNGAGAGDVFTVIPGVAPVAVRFDRTNLVPFGIDLTTVETLEMNGLGGDDSINAGTLTAGLIALELHGGDGNDTLVGSNGIDLITGGIGNDTVDANPGNDSIDLGTGDDTNTWNNGDNTDVVLGGDGNDRQIVNGAGAGDVFTVVPGVAPVAVRFDRTNLVPFAIDLTTVETLEMNSLGGDDSINAGTLPAGLIALQLNGGDANDTLVGSNGVDLITGGPGNDNLRAGPNAAGNPDLMDGGSGDDVVVWNPGDGDDVNAGGEGFDTLLVNGAGVNEQFRIAEIGARFLFLRVLPTTFTLDNGSFELLQLNAAGGDDFVETQPLTGVNQQLDGAATLSAQGNRLQVGGTLAAVNSSPILTPGKGIITYVNFQAAVGLRTGGSFSAALNGAQEVPAVNTTATGRGTVQLNAEETEISVRLSFTGLSSASTVAHIHGPAAPGSNAAPIFDLTGLGGTAAQLGPFSFAVTPQQVAQLKAGLWYFNVHSQLQPSGEIRGQILPDLLLDGPLEGRQVVPRAETLARGYVTATVAGTLDQLTLTLAYSGLTGEGVPGVNTDVGIFGPAVRGVAGVRIGTITLPISGQAADQIVAGPFSITPAQAQQIINGLWYVQVASEEFPQGEIRGQITQSMFFDNFE